MNECFCHTPPVGYSESLCGPSFLFQGSSGTKPDIHRLHYLAKEESITAHLCYFRCQYVNYEFFRRLILKQLLLHKLKRVSKKYLAPSIYSYPYWRLKSNIRFYKGVFCLFGHPLFCRDDWNFDVTGSF